MDDVVHKPFTVRNLAQTIGRLLPDLTTEDNAADLRPAMDVATSPPAAAAGASPDEHDELIDPGVLAQLQQMQAAGKGDFVQKVFKLYVEHAPPAVKRIEEAARARNADECAKVAHALKSMSYNIGAKQVARLALDIETAGKTEGRLPDQSAIEHLSRALTAALEALAGAHGLGGLVEAPAVARRDSEIERLLPRALERDELFVLYQPIVDRSGTRTCCVEALIRWKPADREPVPPSVFIPVAEKTGLIHAIGDWVLRRACQDAAAWPALTLAVNVSPIQFQRPGLADRVSRIIAEAGFDARRLELEITESALLSAERSVLQVMERLNAAGMTFALDDFGTGYSSLNYLRRFPFGKIKIDRSFVTNLSTVDATIVHAVASIGRSLGLKLVAEGVEEAEQQRFLSSAGIHFMQGYLFGKPMTAQEISSRLALECAAADGQAASCAGPIRSVPAA
jgi:EAL domain-containing protein (putative c-di-GMP-specific phosphodiesterase class I)/HPt (histidine-containing phosphotransfer) domain-containing protein